MGRIQTAQSPNALTFVVVWFVNVYDMLMLTYYLYSCCYVLMVIGYENSIISYAYYIIFVMIIYFNNASIYS